VTFFIKDNFSSCEVAGAVAEAAIYDLRVNLFSFNGFPQIHVANPVDDVFNITLSWNDSKNSSVSIALTRKEAKSAAKQFKSGKGYDKSIFERVQTALGKLEGESR
jgi:hypothetical protein